MVVNRKAVEPEKKFNLYTILLLPALAAIVGGIVMLAMYLFMDHGTPAAELPAAPVQKSALALSDLATLFRSFWS